MHRSGPVETTRASTQGKGPVFIDAHPAQLVKGSLELESKAVGLILGMFDGSGARETAVGLDTDYGLRSAQNDPVPPRLFLVARLDFLVPQGGDNFPNGARDGTVRKLDHCIHGAENNAPR